MNDTAASVNDLSAALRLRDLRCVTAIGGGHGLGRVLSALSFLQRRLIGIVATTDDGGASGLLRRNAECIAWGDIRNCLSQLTTQPLAREVLNYRFNDDHHLVGHNFGNLLLYTLEQLSARPLDGIQLLSRLLNVDIRLLPMSESPVDLVASTKEGLHCFGELHVDGLLHMPASLDLSKPVPATPEALRHLRRSDLIILGPGSLLTSVMPPLLVEEFAQTVADSQAPVIFIDNLVPEQSPAGKVALANRLQWMHDQLGVDLVDLIISPHAQPEIEKPWVQLHQQQSQEPHRHSITSLCDALEQALTVLAPKLPKRANIKQV